jgi:ADP-ribose pyrophosphatase
MMADLDRYFQFRKEHPEWFGNADIGYPLLSDREARERVAELDNPGIACEDPWLMVLRDPVRFPSRVGTYFRIIEKPDSGPGVAILPILHDRIILLQIFRHATRQVHVEIPRGFGEIGRPAAEQATGEISEEIGGKILRLVSLGPLHPNTGALVRPRSCEARSGLSRCRPG